MASSIQRKRFIAAAATLLLVHARRLTKLSHNSDYYWAFQNNVQIADDDVMRSSSFQSIASC